MESEQDLNPYASPTAEEAPSDAAQLKDPRLIILPPKSELPRRCVFCNEAAKKPHLLRYRWWMYFWGVFSISIKWYACESCDAQVRPRLRRRWDVLVVTAVCVAFELALDFLPIDLGGLLSTYWYLWAALLAGIAVYSYFETMRRARVELALPTIDRAEPDAVAFKHAGRPFLDSLADGAEGYLVVDKIP